MLLISAPDYYYLFKESFQYYPTTTTTTLITAFYYIDSEDDTYTSESISESQPEFIPNEFYDSDNIYIDI